MKGYKTVVLAGFGLVFAMLQTLGVIVPQDEQAAIQTGGVSLLMLIMRLVTSTPVGEK